MAMFLVTLYRAMANASGQVVVLYCSREATDFTTPLSLTFRMNTGLTTQREGIQSTLLMADEQTPIWKAP